MQRIHTYIAKYTFNVISVSVFRALLNILKCHSHLMEVDPLLVRSCLYLMTFDDLVECAVNLNVGLLDMLHVFFSRAPQEITSSTVTVGGNTSFKNQIFKR